jgi:hypothetical protein
VTALIAGRPPSRSYSDLEEALIEEPPPSSFFIMSQPAQSTAATIANDSNAHFMEDSFSLMRQIGAT